MGYAPSEAHWFVFSQCPLQGEHICMCLSSCRAFLWFWGNGSFVFRQKWYHMHRDFCTASACRFLRIPVESLTEEESWKAGEACGRHKQVQRKNRRREGSAADSVFRRHRVRGYGDARGSEKVQCLPYPRQKTIPPFFHVRVLMKRHHSKQAEKGGGRVD